VTLKVHMFLKSELLPAFNNRWGVPVYSSQVQWGSLKKVYNQIRITAHLYVITHCLH